jgi:hypothetical protein
MITLTIDSILSEGTIKNENALWLKSMINGQPGRLYLTSKRIAFLKEANAFAGLLKLFVKSARSAFLFNIELNRIKKISREALGVNKNVLTINYNDEQVKFLVSDFEAWDFHLHKLTRGQLLKYQV